MSETSVSDKVVPGAVSPKVSAKDVAEEALSKHAGWKESLKEIVYKNAKLLYSAAAAGGGKAEIRENYLLGHSATVFCDADSVPAHADENRHDFYDIRFGKNFRACDSSISTGCGVAGKKFKLFVRIKLVRNSNLDVGEYKVGNVYDNKIRAKTIDLDNLDPHNYEAIDESILLKLSSAASLAERRSLIQTLTVKKLRYLCRYLGIAVKPTKAELQAHVLSHYVARARALYADGAADRCNMMLYYTEALEESTWEETVADTTAHVYSAQMADYYPLLTSLVSNNDSLTLYPGNSTFNVLSPLSSGEPVKIVVSRNRSKVPVGDKRCQAENLLLLDELVVKKEIGDSIPKKGVLLTFCYEKTLPPVTPAAAQGPKSDLKLNLPPETLAKGTIQDLPMEFFTEHGLEKELAEALFKEIKALLDNGVFEVVPVPGDRKIMTSRIIDGIKTRSDGTFLKVKERFVPRGFLRNDYRGDYLRKDTVMTSAEGVHLVLQKALQEDWLLSTYDFMNAFLQSIPFESDELMPYVHFPPIDRYPEAVQKQLREMFGIKPGHCMRFKKCCYGFLDAPRAWHRTLTEELVRLGFRPLRSDPGVYVIVADNDDKIIPVPRAIQDGKVEDEEAFEKEFSEITPLPAGQRVCGVLSLHVDDTLTGGDHIFQALMKRVTERFRIGAEWTESSDKKSQTITFLGRDIQILRDETGARTIRLTQEEYANKLTEMDVPDGPPEKPLSPEEHSIFRATVGRLNWIAYRSRPDLAFAVHTASTQVAAPTVQNARELNKTVRTAKYSKSVALTFRKMKGPLRIVALTDASFNRVKACPSYYAGLFFIASYDADYDQNIYSADPATVRDKSDAPVFCDASLLYWRTRVVKRRVDAILDVETLSIQYGTCVAKYLDGLGTELGLFTGLKPVIYNDNQSTVSHLKSTNRHSNARMNVLWETLRRAYTENEYALQFICGKTLNISDCLTKLKTPLNTLLLKALRLGKLYLPKL